MKKIITILLILTVIISFSQTNEHQFKSKYGITTTLQSQDAMVGVSVPLSNVFSLIPTIGLDYNLNTSKSNTIFGLALQINMGSNKLVPYGIIRYGYSNITYSSYGIGYGGEYYFLPRVSANIELQLNIVNDILTTGTGLGVTYYFGE